MCIFLSSKLYYKNKGIPNVTYTGFGEFKTTLADADTWTVKISIHPSTMLLTNNRRPIPITFGVLSLFRPAFDLYL